MDHRRARQRQLHLLRFRSEEASKSGELHGDAVCRQREALFSTTCELCLEGTRACARTFAASQGEGLGSVIPAHGDLLKIAAFMVEGRAVVVVESEGAVCPWIHGQRQRLS